VSQSRGLAVSRRRLLAPVSGPAVFSVSVSGRRETARGRPPGLPAGHHQAGSAAVTEGDDSQGAMAVRWAHIADLGIPIHG
jgi:hypothetical protein